LPRVQLGRPSRLHDRILNTLLGEDLADRALRGWDGELDDEYASAREVVANPQRLIRSGSPYSTVDAIMTSRHSVSKMPEPM
jgi:hypothetical protein